MPSDVIEHSGVTTTMSILVSRLGSSLSHRGRRGARPARREEGEYREYLTDEQRRGAGCIGGRMQTNFRDTTLALGEKASPALCAVLGPSGIARHDGGGS